MRFQQTYPPLSCRLVNRLNCATNAVSPKQAVRAALRFLAYEQAILYGAQFVSGHFQGVGLWHRPTQRLL